MSRWARTADLLLFDAARKSANAIVRNLRELGLVESGSIVLSDPMTVLSLTSAKSSALVGVFISITTVPAVATIGLTLAVGAWGEAWDSAAQLGLNLLGLLVAGIGTLLVQRLAWHRLRLLGTRRRAGDAEPRRRAR